MRSLWIAVLVFVLPAIAVAGTRDRESPWRGRRHRDEFRGIPDGYVAVKGGGLVVTGDGPEGVYLGLEAGGSAAGKLDLGFSLDYFHRSTRELEVLFETDHGFDPPIRGERTTFESTADFVPVGVTARVRVPAASGGFVPFVSGTLAYEVLHLSFFDRTAPSQPYDEVLGTSQTFWGFGWQASAGVEVSLGEGYGLFGELGLHRGTPSREIEIDGEPVDLRVRMNGGFARAGLRIAL